jgi:hypothetical protein
VEERGVRVDACRKRLRDADVRFDDESELAHPGGD